MSEARSNYFELEKCNTTLYQAKIGKYEWFKIAAMYSFKIKIENNSTWEGAFIKVNELKLTQVELF